MTADDVPWLTAEERAAWVVLAALTALVPAAVEAQLQRDDGLTFFEYTVLAMLSEQEDRTLRMSELAGIAHGSLSRLSHVARRLEARGYLRRAPLPEDGRVTIARLTDEGLDAVRAAAPGHVRHVRRSVLDALDAEDLEHLHDLGLRIISAIDPRAAAAVGRATDAGGR